MHDIMILFYSYLLSATVEADKFRVRDNMFFYFLPERRHGRGFGQIEDRVERVELEVVVMRRSGRRARAKVSRASRRRSFLPRSLAECSLLL